MCVSAALQAQSLDNASLNGAYHFTRFEMSAQAGVVASARNVAGLLTFDGAGGLTFSGETISPNPAPLEAAGSYAVRFTGEVEIDDPLRPGGKLSGMISGDGMLLMGDSIDPPAGFLDMFFAVPASTEADAATLSGAYTLSAFEMPAGDLSTLRSTLISMTSDGAGALRAVFEVGHERGSINLFQNATGAAYAIEPDGSGELTLGGLALASGLRRIFVSPDGAYFIALPAAGFQGVLVGSRLWDEGLPSDFVALYWIAEMGFDGAQFYSATGTALPDRVASVLVSERVQVPSAGSDYSGRNYFAVTEGGRGWFGPQPFSGVYNMALSAVEDPGFAGAIVGAQIGALGEASEQFGVFVMVRPPLFDVSEGYFIDFRGIVNGASFAQPPSPLAPGLISTVFGANLIGVGVSGASAATSVPLPTELAGASIRINGVAAPFFFASQFQDNFQVPYTLTGEQATVEISNGEGALTFTRRLAPTSPGIFTTSQFDHSGYSAVVTHADGSLVLPANPARQGEVVIFWVAGLGEMNPPIPTGAANPGLGGETLARPVDQQVQVLVGGRVARTFFVGAAPGFVGLSQINAEIPPQAAVGDRVPVAILTSNAVQDQADLAVATAAAATEEGAAASEAPVRRAPRMRLDLDR